MSLQSYPAHLRLRKKAEYQVVYTHGRRYSTAHFVVYILPKAQTRPRTGLAVSKKVGCAVQRNRVKRLLREFFRLHAELLPQAADIAVVAKKQACYIANLHQVEVELGSLCAKLS
ncbi:MAG: ribonuclease P protein component [Desulfovibrionaceae bacterium]|nr:ribonuclease P protein component [Desulfovibrionaceae bacterium]